MRKFKKTLAILMAVALSATAFVGCKKDDDTTGGANAGTATNEGKVLNIYCWNDEFKSRLETFAPDVIPSDVTVNWVITPNNGGTYQQKLDAALIDQPYAAADDKVDLFLIEADYAMKYVGTSATLPVEKVGVTADDVKDQYSYTKEIVTDANGDLKAVSWQATPGLFAYRSDIAEEVLGTSDPDEVQEYLKDWDTFDATAAKMKEAGYFMVSGYDDTYRVFSNNVTTAWVDDNNKIQIDDNLKAWVDQTKTYSDNGYNDKTSLWAPEWTAGMGAGSKVFGYFWSTWGFNFSLLGASLADPDAAQELGNGTFGLWRAADGPQAYFWGGTWLCAANGTDNGELVGEIMKELTCNADVMKKITADTADFTNNIPAMDDLASDYSFDLLGGQNHLGKFAAAAPKIKMDKTSKYDQTCNEEFQGAMRNYFIGEMTYEEALEAFYTSAMTKQPALTK